MDYHKSGFVSILGMPNVGKSSLLNSLLRFPLSIVNQKAQTTRHQILGILNNDNYQIVFVDTPGLLEPKYVLQEVMITSIKESIDCADLFLLLFDKLEDSIQWDNFIEVVKSRQKKIIVLINKIDTMDQIQLESLVSYYHNKFSKSEIIPISIKESFNLDILLSKIVEQMPIHPPYFDKDQISDRQERFFVNEKIRQEILTNFKQEIPYAVEVQTEEFLEADNLIQIRALIFVERISQKKILIGHKGIALKKLSKQAKEILEEFFRKTIHLSLYIKVRKDWRKNIHDLKSFGYNVISKTQ